MCRACRIWAAVCPLRMPPKPARAARRGPLGSISRVGFHALCVLKGGYAAVQPMLPRLL